MREILQEYSPFIQQYSIDEYFMDYSDMAADFPDPIQAAYTIKHRIATELGFTVNIGISNNKLLAKMASELEKPDKVHTLFPEEIPEKMWILPVEDMFMVGRATAPKLRSRGIYSIGDLAKCDPNLLRSWLKSQGVMLWNYAHGIESSPIKNAAIPIKGIGNSTTIPFDVDDARTAHMVMLSLVEMVSARLRQTSLLGEVVSVSLKTHELFSYSHQKKLDSPTDCTNAIYREAINLFDEAWEREPLRHLGVRISELCSNDLYQMTIYDQMLNKQKTMDRAVDQIRTKHGNQALIRSCFLHAGVKPISGGVIEEEFPMMSSIL
jgi:DNA polymerase-4